MKKNSKNGRAISTYILMFLLLFQAVSAIPSGLLMVFDPSGKTLGVPIEMLQESPFNNFLIPALFLLIILGIFPAIIVFALIKKTKSLLAEKINLHKNYHWSWTFSYYVGLLLVLWINMQQFFIKSYSVLHFVYSMLGVVIIFIAHLPATRNDYKIDSYKK